MNHEVPNFQAHTFLNTEGNHFYSRSMHSIDNELKFSYSKYIFDQLKPFESEIRNIFEIGCGDGNICSMLSELFHSSGYGVDPSSIAVATGNAQFNNIELPVGISSELFPANHSMDLVYFGFCLYLVDRDLLMQSIAEASRILRYVGFLVVLDFDPNQRVKVEYKHHPNIWTYKDNYSEYFLTGGQFALISKQSFSHTSNYFVEDRSERLSISILYKEPIPYQAIVATS